MKLFRYQKLDKLKKIIWQGSLTLLLVFAGTGQSNFSSRLWDQIEEIAKDSSDSDKNKITRLLRLKDSLDNSGYIPDSSYARILDRITYLDYLDNNERVTLKGIAYTIDAFDINNSDKPGASKNRALHNASNLAYYFQDIGNYRKAMNYLDSAVLLIKENKISSERLPELHARKSDLYFLLGDYDKAIEQVNIGILKAENLNQSSFWHAYLLNQRVQIFLWLQDYRQADLYADTAINFAVRTNETFHLASALKNKAILWARVKNYDSAKKFFLKAITTRKSLTEELSQISQDYIDYGNYYAASDINFDLATKCYKESMQYASRNKDSSQLAKCYVNIGALYYDNKQYDLAEKNYQNAIGVLTGIPLSPDLKMNVPSSRLDLVADKDLVIVILDNKTEVELTQYKMKHDPQYLSAAIKTARLTDTIIDKMRQEQTGETSKLIWRERTRNLYPNAIEACFDSRDAEQAFFFMEKSRSVLLNDRLNELGARSHLPADSVTMEENFIYDVTEQEQKLNILKEGTFEYKSQYQIYLEKKHALEGFINSLEKNYPAYYAYKYSNAVPDLKTMQQYLDKNNQSFVHYFVSDSVLYGLAITSTGTRMEKQSIMNFQDTLSAFLRLCANRQMLNANYSSFANASNKIYQTLFEPLQIPAGRVVVCTDNFMIPFEALCGDKEGEKFLAEHYAFSYVYSAGYLLKKFTNTRGKGDFIGFAPVSFKEYLNLPDLKNSDKYLEQSADFYPGTKLLTGKNATKENFLSMVSSYEIINVFSHAKADSSGMQPVLYLCDSSVMLSELQKIVNPSARLVVLSACQTNVGKAATGEGIYSLARGFAASGIPGVAATMWKADDLTIYEITKRFHENISKGLPADEALQQAKLSFLENNSKERALPYYWANMIFVGSAEPVELTAGNRMAWLIGGILLLLIATIIIRIKNKLTAHANNANQLKKNKS